MNGGGTDGTDVDGAAAAGLTIVWESSSSSSVLSKRYVVKWSNANRSK